MNKHNILRACTLALALGGAIAIAGGRQSPPPRPSVNARAHAKPKPQVAAQHKVIVYYFHGNYRCASCRRIEAWTASAVQTSFASDIRAGRLEWRVINVEQPGNEHYARDYRLFTKSVVLSDVRGGKQVRWSNLSKVWELLRDESGFRKYITDEVRAYLGDRK